MTEDEIYRQSTQYRLWSFTPEALGSLRANTNSLAAERVKLAYERRRTARSQASSADGSAATSEAENNGTRNGTDGAPAAAASGKEIECLTAEEAQKLVEFYCSQCLRIAKTFDFPTHVVGTAVQYIKRFYLYNSPMTYHPKEIMLSALFLSTKTQHFYTSLESYVTGLISKAGVKPKDTSAEKILAPEFIITQGLRFTFDVRHPHRGLKGVHMELLTLASGHGTMPGDDGDSATALQCDMLKLPDPSGGSPGPRSQEALRARIDAAYASARETLGGAALLTDAYFLYTPSQILLASLLLADGPLLQFYLGTKVRQPSPQFAKLHNTLRGCAALLDAGGSAANESRDELVRIDKKLYQCRNPDKKDLVGLSRAQKRDKGAEGELDGGLAKKRRLERERGEKEGEELFGPGLAAIPRDGVEG